MSTTSSKKRRPMVQLAFRFMREAEHRRPRRVWRTLQPTKWGIRERLVSQGYIPGTAVYRFAYHKAFAAMFPDDIRFAKNKYEDEKAARAGRLRFQPLRRGERGRVVKGPRNGKNKTR